MKRSLCSLLPLISVIAFCIIVVISIFIKDKYVNIDTNSNNSDSLTSREYFDSYSFYKLVNGQNLNITLKYYKDDFKFEDSCFKVYFDLFINDKLIKSYRENSPYEVKTSSLVYTSNYCYYDNTENDDTDKEIALVNEYIRKSSFVIMSDKEYLALMLPIVHVSSNSSEEKVVIVNDKLENIYSFYILNQKKKISSYRGCSKTYNNSLYRFNTKMYEKDVNALYYLDIDAYLNDGVLSINENKLTVSKDEVKIETINRCTGK